LVIAEVSGPQHLDGGVAYDATDLATMVSGSMSEPLAELRQPAVPAVQADHLARSRRISLPGHERSLGRRPARAGFAGPAVAPGPHRTT
jgi:hypothetical protein